MQLNVYKFSSTGYTILAGWTIMAVTSALQLNPETFEDPLAFNPWRWKVIEIVVLNNVKANNIDCFHLFHFFL